MKHKESSSMYQLLGQAIRSRFQEGIEAEKIEIHKMVRKLRQERGLTGVEVCRRAGDLNPKTLAAIENGHIINPSIKTFQSLARGLGVTVSELFLQTELAMERHFYVGSQKGAFQMEFPSLGVKAISFTPLNRDFFCGKIIVGPKRRIDQTFWKSPIQIYLSILVGRLEIEVESRRVILREGENVFFNGVLRHVFYNPMHRDAVFLMVTAPSFL
ncbi:MAG: helix-turn-helix transcriptional regulator [Candidatus Omnitrophica bacterium]|nr:helix-turn-helix transcriptional regulator [Candidatus Omnitrophota bacterium]